MSAITAQEQEAQMLDTAQIATQVHDLDFYQWVQTTIDIERRLNPLT